MKVKIEEAHQPLSQWLNLTLPRVSGPLNIIPALKITRSHSRLSNRSVIALLGISQSPPSLPFDLLFPSPCLSRSRRMSLLSRLFLFLSSLSANDATEIQLFLPSSSSSSSASSFPRLCTFRCSAGGNRARWRPCVCRCVFCCSGAGLERHRPERPLLRCGFCSAESASLCPDHAAGAEQRDGLTRWT